MPGWGGTKTILNPSSPLSGLGTTAILKNHPTPRSNFVTIDSVLDNATSTGFLRQRRFTVASSTSRQVAAFLNFRCTKCWSLKFEHDGALAQCPSPSLFVEPEHGGSGGTAQFHQVWGGKHRKRNVSWAKLPGKGHETTSEQKPYKFILS